mmetsp:Transcript_14533/g.40295  ORF Transcript_14533/g.40295 Transcript_14533/m.40295 type:complete len:92 (-) Transcript_14533:24-299(-)
MGRIVTLLVAAWMLLGPTISGTNAFVPSIHHHHHPTLSSPCCNRHVVGTRGNIKSRLLDQQQQQQLPENNDSSIPGLPMADEQLSGTTTEA